MKNNFIISKLGKSVVNYDYNFLKKENAKFLASKKFSDVKKNLILLGMNNIDEAFWKVVQKNIFVLKDVGFWYDICKTAIKPVIIDSNFTTYIAKLLLDFNFSDEIWDEWIKKIKEKTGRTSRNLFLPIRLALTGHNKGPELKKIFRILCRNKVIARLNGIIA